MESNSHGAFAVVMPFNSGNDKNWMFHLLHFLMCFSVVPDSWCDAISVTNVWNDDRLPKG